jgi:hypothetical protein
LFSGREDLFMTLPFRIKGLQNILVRHYFLTEEVYQIGIVCQRDINYKTWGALSVIITGRNVECFLRLLIC